MSVQAAQSLQPDTRVVGTDGAGTSGGSSSTTGSSHGDNRSLKERAEEAARDAKMKADALASDASEAAKAEAASAAARAKELASQLQTQAVGIADEAVDRVRNTADAAISEQRDRAAGFVGTIERAVDAAADSLREDGYGTIANYVRYASRTLSSVNDEVTSFEPQQLTGRAERAVRRNPLVTYGALAVAGFALVTLINSQNNR